MGVVMRRPQSKTKAPTPPSTRPDGTDTQPGVESVVDLDPTDGGPGVVLDAPVAISTTETTGGFDRFPTAPVAASRPVPDAISARVPALDGLRGLAAAAVVVFHLGFMNGGWLAVDLFFTLSGFLITTLLLREWGAHDRVRLGGFWGRRARRLLPALAVLLALVAVLTLVAGETAAALHKQAWSTALYVSNWTAVFSPQSYWELFTSRSPLEHTWSLAIEEQFYLVWPLICFVVLRLSKGRVGALAAATGALLAGSLTAMFLLYTPGDDTNRVYFGTDTRAASILVGALLACWLARRPQHMGMADRRWRELPTIRRAGRAVLEVTAVAAAVGLLWAWLFVDGTTPAVYRGGLFLHALAAAVLIAAALHPVRGVVARALSLRPLVWLGIISYGVYLFHWPVIWWLSPERTGLSPIPLALLQATVTLGVATASWFLVERHVLHGRVALPKLLPVLAVTATVAVAVVLVTPVQSPSGAVTLAAGGEDDSVGTAGHFDLPAAPVPAPPAAPGLAFPPAQPAYRVLFAGDSVPYSIAKNWQPSPDQIVTGSVAIPSCDGARGGRIRFPLNMYVQDKPDCQNWPQLWPDALALFQPDAVVLMLGMAAIQDRQVDGVYTRPCESRFDNWYAGEVDYRLSFLEQRTTSPILLTLSPYGDDQSIGVLPANHRQRTNCLNAIYRQVGGRHPGVQLVDFGSWLCPDGVCRTEIDGEPFRPDGLHLSPPAATAAGEWLVEQAKLVGLARLNESATTTTAAAPETTDAPTTEATSAPVTSVDAPT